MPNRSVLLLLSLLALGCRTTTESAPAGADEVEITVGELVASWRVCCGGQTHGWLRRYTAEGVRQSSIFVVQNEFGQDIGYVDAHGRAWRRVPHEERPVWLTTDTVVEGVRRILELGPEVELNSQPTDGTSPEAAKSTGDNYSPGIPAAGLRSASAKKRG